MGLRPFLRRWHVALARQRLRSLCIGHVLPQRRLRSLCIRHLLPQRRFGIHYTHWRDRGGGGEIIFGADGCIGRCVGARDRRRRLLLGYWRGLVPSRGIAGDILIEELGLEVGLDRVGIAEPVEGSATLDGAAVAYGEHMGDETESVELDRAAQH